jgi:CheY-like chemotaxis protein
MAHRQILLVDDNPIQAATRRIILERTGATVRVASSGIQALTILDSPDEKAVRLLITDHLMPGMNGPELVQAVRDRNLQIPIVVLSGLPDAAEQYDGLDVLFRLKPFHPDSLIALVHELLDEPPMQRSA